MKLVCVFLVALCAAAMVSASQPEPVTFVGTEARVSGAGDKTEINQSAEETAQEKIVKPSTATITDNDKASAQAVRAGLAAKAAQSTHWTYCMNGPGLWAELDTRFRTCKTGLTQSPINIVEAEVQANSQLAPLEFDYKLSNANLVNDGHALTLNYDAGSILTVDGEKQFELLSVSIKTPAEHKINGEAADAEIQFVHKSSSRDTLVLSVLVKTGGKHAELDKIVGVFPAHSGVTTVPNLKVSAAEFFPQKNQQYFTYWGSLSSPPCTERVQWYVFQQPIEMSEEQLQKLKVRIPFNARLPQPLNGRAVQVSSFKVDANGKAVLAPPPVEPKQAEWSYCMNGPDRWAELSNYFDLCKDGEHQSPINIVKGNVAKSDRDGPIKFNYKESELVILNSGHTIQLNIDPGSNVVVGGKKFELLQIHFHTPSEHLIDGKAAPLEAYFTHKAPSDNQLLVVTVLLQEGAANPTFGKFWDNLPRSKITVDLKEKIDPNTLLPATAPQGYFHYSGSLSAPPCSENVEYYVLQEPLTMSKEQIDAFHAIIDHNARPVNTLYGRKVTMPVTGFIKPPAQAGPKTLAGHAAKAATKAEDPTA
eukprot:TRINITY_DN1664_c0_g1_i1.p1 TRINITY_DN1664_c0_g1~~TRINITY_DN1664_c0_g1_i1.p1  ORF type:complete len:591 (-),score=215.08 TRINITY_DN1664_c0_g1_i1:452-2224(-)